MPPAERTVSLLAIQLALAGQIKRMFVCLLHTDVGALHVEKYRSCA